LMASVYRYVWNFESCKRFRQCERLSDWNSAGFFLTIYSTRFQYVFALYWLSFTPSFRQSGEILCFYLFLVCLLVVCFVVLLISSFIHALWLRHNGDSRPQILQTIDGIVPCRVFLTFSGVQQQVHSSLFDDVGWSKQIQVRLAQNTGLRSVFLFFLCQILWSLYWFCILETNSSCKNMCMENIIMMWWAYYHNQKKSTLLEEAFTEFLHIQWIPGLLSWE
jgi:hypothetical protein